MGTNGQRHKLNGDREEDYTNDEKIRRVLGEEQIEKVEHGKLRGTVSQKEFGWTYSSSRGWGCLRRDLEKLCRSKRRSLIRKKRAPWELRLTVYRDRPVANIYIYIHIKSKKATVKIRRKFAELCSREPCLYRTYFKFMTQPRNQCCYRNKKLKYLIRHKSYQRAKKREHFSKNPLMSSRLLDSRGNMRIRGLTGRIVSQCWTLCNPDWE